jgi:hypothetical protein
MTEELKMSLPEGVELAPESPEEPQGEPAAPELSEVEQEAMTHGWKPESEFESKTGKKWKTAEQFMELKPLYDKIDEQHREVKNLKKGLEAFGKHYNKMEQATYERAMTDLKSQRKTALEEGDLVLAEDIRDQMEFKKREATLAPVVEAPQEDRTAEMNSWKQRNDWYEKDEDMTAYADGVGNKLLRSGKDPTDILAEVSKRTRAAFPHKFRNPNKDTAPKVESGSSGRNRGGSETSGLTAGEIQIMEQLIRSGAPITREAYIKDLKKSKGV